MSSVRRVPKEIPCGVARRLLDFNAALPPGDGDVEVPAEVWGVLVAAAHNDTKDWFTLRPGREATTDFCADMARVLGVQEDTDVSTIVNAAREVMYELATQRTFDVSVRDALRVPDDASHIEIVRLVRDLVAASVALDPSREELEEEALAPCRNCAGEHFTKNCPEPKFEAVPAQKKKRERKKKTAAEVIAAQAEAEQQTCSSCGDAGHGPADCYFGEPKQVDLVDTIGGAS